MHEAEAVQKDLALLAKAGQFWLHEQVALVVASGHYSMLKHTSS
jgi:hypothetical protein